MNDSELVIRIRTVAELKDAERAKTAVESAIKATQGDAVAQATLRGQLDQVNAALATKEASILKVQSAVEQAGAAVAKLKPPPPAAPPPPTGLVDKVKEMKAEFAEAGGGVKGFLTVLMGSGAAVAGWAAAIVGGIGLATKALSVFMQKQVEVAKLDAVLANQGKLTDEYREKLQALAGAMAKATATGGGDWLQALTTLNKFGANTSNIDQYAEAVKNLAGFMEGGIPEAAFLFGKAMQGNHAMLGRYGIEVDATKTRTEQLAQIMQQAAERGGGVMESRAQTLTGQFELFHGSVKKLWSGFGNLISQSGLVQAGLGLLTGTLNLLASVLPKTVPAVDGLKNSLSALTPEAKSAAEQVAELSHAKVGEGVQQGAEAATKALSAEVDALRKLQGELDQQGDEELKQKLAGIDLAEAQLKAKGGLTASAKEGFEQQRRAARRDTEGRKLTREEGTATLAQDVAQGDLAGANQALQSFRDKTQPGLDTLKANRDRLALGSNIEGLGGFSAAKIFLDKEIAAIKTELGGTIVRESTRQTGIRPGELNEELTARQAQLAALKGFPAADAAYTKAREQAAERESELSKEVTKFSKAVSEASAQLRSLATRRSTFGAAGQTEQSEAESNARKSAAEDRAKALEASAKEQQAIAESTNPAVSPAARARAQAAQKALSDAAKVERARATEDPNERRAAVAGLPAGAQSAGVGFQLAANPEIQKLATQAATLLQQNGQMTAQGFRIWIAELQKANQALAAATARTNLGRP